MSATETDDHPEPIETTSEPGGDPARKLYPKDWLEIITLAKEGTPVERIAQIFKVRKSTIYRGLKKRSIRIGAYAASAEEVVENESRKILIERIKTLKDSDYRLTDHIQRRAAKLVIDADASSTPYAAIADNLKALDTAMKIIRAGTDNKWKILGLDKDNQDADRELPELPVRELTQHEVNAIRDKQLLEDEMSDEELDALDDLVEDVEPV